MAPNCLLLISTPDPYAPSLSFSQPFFFSFYHWHIFSLSTSAWHGGCFSTIFSNAFFSVHFTVRESWLDFHACGQRNKCGSSWDPSIRNNTGISLSHLQNRFLWSKRRNIFFFYFEPACVEIFNKYYSYICSNGQVAFIFCYSIQIQKQLLFLLD